MQALTRMPGLRVSRLRWQLDCFFSSHQIFARCSLDGIRAWEPKTRVIDFPGFWLRLRPLVFLLLEDV
jgi:hypothetical protein